MWAQLSNLLLNCHFLALLSSFHALLPQTTIVSNPFAVNFHGFQLFSFPYLFIFFWWFSFPFSMNPCCFLSHLSFLPPPLGAASLCKLLGFSSISAHQVYSLPLGLQRLSALECWAGLVSLSCFLAAMLLISVDVESWAGTSGGWRVNPHACPLIVTSLNPVDSLHSPRNYQLFFFFCTRPLFLLQYFSSAPAILVEPTIPSLMVHHSGLANHSILSLLNCTDWFRVSHLIQVVQE